MAMYAMKTRHEIVLMMVASGNLQLANIQQNGYDGLQELLLCRILLSSTSMKYFVELIS